MPAGKGEAAAVLVAIWRGFQTSPPELFVQNHLPGPGIELGSVESVIELERHSHGSYPYSSILFQRLELDKPVCVTPAVPGWVLGTFRVLCWEMLLTAPGGSLSQGFVNPSRCGLENSSSEARSLFRWLPRKFALQWMCGKMVFSK